MEIISTESTVLLIDTSSQPEDAPRPMFKKATYGIIKNIAHYIVLATHLMIGMLIVMHNKDYVQCNDVMFVFMVSGFYVKLVIILMAIDLKGFKKLVITCALVYFMCVAYIIILVESTKCDLPKESKNVQYADFSLTLILSLAAVVKIYGV